MFILNFCCFLSLALLVVSQTNLPQNSMVASSIPRNTTYYFTTNSKNFEVDVWRTSSYSGPTNRKPVVSFKLQNSDTGLTLRSGYGSLTYSNSFNPVTNFTVQIDGSGTPYNYVIRWCTSCSSPCPTDMYGDFCYGYGYCDYYMKQCNCDKLNISMTASCSTFTLPDDWTRLLGLWVGLIVFGLILVFVVPCIICCCCMGICATATVAATAAAVSEENRTLVHTVYVNSPQSGPSPQGHYRV